LASAPGDVGQRHIEINGDARGFVGPGIALGEDDAFVIAHLRGAFVDRRAV
jgi:hypothetical protein